jgi:type IV secretory pathway VirB2 component (pilin)
VEKWLVTILGKAKEMASASVMGNIRTSVQEMVDHAATTDNPWDDIFAWILQMIVGKPGDTTKPIDEE